MCPEMIAPGNIDGNEEGAGLVGMLHRRPIALLEEFATITAEELEVRFPGDNPIAACDFGISGIENGEEFPGGYRKGRVMSVDHHAPTKRMARQVSSTTLAIEQANISSFPEDATVVIHHTDCDSILSSAIVSGFLPPEDRFNDAAIAADHTGEANDIANLLQSLQNRRDMEYSFRNLDHFLRGEPLEQDAQASFDDRKAQREHVKELVGNGSFRSIGGVFFAYFQERLDSVLFPSLLSDAAVILIGGPMKSDPEKTYIKVRLGMKAPAGFALNELDLPDFGGRWNAGNTKRHGGTAIPIEEYAGLIGMKLEEFFADTV